MAGQLVQELEPDASAYLPAGHTVHGDRVSPLAEKVPGSHSVGSAGTVGGCCSPQYLYLRASEASAREREGGAKGESELKVDEVRVAG
jgi:hypothetical protein